MRPYILTSAFVLLAATGAALVPLPQVRIPGPGAPQSASSCTTTVDTLSGSINNNVPLGAQTATAYVASAFAAGSSYSICAFTTTLKAVGTPTGTLTGYIYSSTSPSDFTGLPSALIGSGSTGWTCGGTPSALPPTSDTSCQFTGLSGVSLTSGTTYWIVLTGIPHDIFNYVNLETYSLSNGTANAPSGPGSWSHYSSGSTAPITTYK